MIRRTKEYILENKMIKNHSTVLVALSGGADSVCLLLLLNEIKRQCANELDFALVAVHVEHGIRGAESREDARFASDLCERLHIPCHVHSVDVPQYAKSHGLGLEEAARILRYEAFEKEAEQNQDNSRQVVVAVAHHMEDNAETVLFQMLRGSGAKGLSGMYPVSVKNGVTYIRPLLSATRAQIEDYLRENGQAFVTDATNTDTAYSRNKLRHDVFPLLLQINDRAIEHINESAGQLAVMNDFYEEQLKEACDSMVSKKEGRVILEISRFESLHPALKSGVARECIHLASGRLKDITSTHIGALVKLAGQQSGRKINLPYGILAEKSFGEVILYAGAGETQKEEIHVTAKELEALSATGEQKNIRLSADGSYVTLCIHDFNGKMDEIPKKPYTKWFDYDKMKEGFEIRTRKAGDYIIVDDEGHHKKLKQVFTGDKIPAQQRAGLWLIAHESLVHAIIGYRSGCSALVTPQTGKVLKITFYGGKQNGFFKEI
ncbi:tRNA lysidine(34) synthetase TilS [Agathobacter sp.]|uniref:tRNA lysidine(34) synthetase TilS n=1 Tax=Agathobacter sp. TaxID=2021311 RepID=UPI003FD884AE